MAQRRSIHSVLHWLALLMGVLFAPAAPLLAHGGGVPRVINEPAGPYLVSIWTDPDPLRVDESHVDVAVSWPDTREPLVSGIQVFVDLQNAADPSLRAREEATTAQSANKTIFVAVFKDLPVAGRWVGTVTVDGESGPSGPITFEVDILPPAPFPWLRVLLIAAALMALIGLAGWQLRRQPRQPRPRRRPQS